MPFLTSKEVEKNHLTYFKDNDIFKYFKDNDIFNMNQIICSRKIHMYSLKDFKEELAQGYIRLIKIEEDLVIQVVNTYNNESLEEEIEFLEQGFIKVGYPSKQNYKRH